MSELMIINNSTSHFWFKGVTYPLFHIENRDCWIDVEEFKTEGFELYSKRKHPTSANDFALILKNNNHGITKITHIKNDIVENISIYSDEELTAETNTIDLINFQANFCKKVELNQLPSFEKNKL